MSSPRYAPAVNDRPIQAAWLGRMSYREAWALQKQLVAERASGQIDDRLLLLEHPAVLTIGKHGDQAHLLATPAELERRGGAVRPGGRGGGGTAPWHPPPPSPSRAPLRQRAPR